MATKQGFVQYDDEDIVLESTDKMRALRIEHDVETENDDHILVNIGDKPFYVSRVKPLFYPDIALGDMTISSEDEFLLDGIIKTEEE